MSLASGRCHGQQSPILRQGAPTDEDPSSGQYRELPEFGTQMQPFRPRSRHKQGSQPSDKPWFTTACALDNRLLAAITDAERS